MIFTVSPVRHLGDGLTGNALSKSLLRVAVEQICQRHPKAEYFPSFEILNDELRDYRFYADDMTHPSDVAVDYIWQRFAEAAFDSPTRRAAEDAQRIVQAAEHRPFAPDSEQYRTFCRTMTNRIEALEAQYPTMDFADERNISPHISDKSLLAWGTKPTAEIELYVTRKICKFAAETTKKMKRLHILATALALAAAVPSLAAERPAPRILVNIVVSSMRANDLDRYADNFSQSGFLRLRDQGRRFTEAEYDYMQTTTPVSLATIVTGAMPSTHGVVAAQWYDYVTNKQVGLIDDAECQSVNFSGGSGGYSPRNLVAQTLSDALARQDEASRIATVAIEPLSAIVTAGHSGEVYWMETLQTAWTTSSYYTKTLPAWIADYNRNQANLGYLLDKWTPLLQYDTYHNSQVLDIEGLKSHKNKRIEFIGDESSSALPVDEYNLMCYTPAGNSALLAFARHIITNDEMGRDEHPDILNVVLDTPRKISERFGPESVEYEDMLYRLDRDIEEFISFLLTRWRIPRRSS